jgi:hypothetical protein
MSGAGMASESFVKGTASAVPKEFKTSNGALAPEVKVQGAPWQI